MLHLFLYLPVALAAAAPAPDAVSGWVSAYEEPIELTLGKLMSFEYRAGEAVPQEILDLDGKQVVIKGLMAIGTLEGVSEFELVSDACGCGQSKMNHFVKVQLEDDTTGYTPKEVTVTGTFEVGEEIEDGFVTSLFRIVADELEK